MNKGTTVLYLTILLLTMVGIASHAQTNDAGAVEVPIDEYDRGSPSRSARGFMAAADEGNFERATEYLDLRNLRGEARELTGPQLARRLKVVIERASWEDIDDLVDDPAGRVNDGLPDYRDSIGVVLDEDRNKEYRLYMQKVPRGDGEFIWKVSNATVSLIPELYDTYGYPESIETLRRKLPNVSFLGFELFKWIIVLSAAALAYALVFLFALMVRRGSNTTDLLQRERIFSFLVLPAGIWATFMAMNLTATSLGRGATASTIQKASPVSILVTTWFLFAVIGVLRDVYATRLRDQGRQAGVVLLRPASNALKLLVAIGAGLFYLEKLGINISTVLAGLGVGGIAVALALQKPMEDVFGAITLYTQQPARVGDFCRIGNETGTIEEIGLRTTRIRTLANTVITMPNSKLASEAIDNISARQKIWYRPVLRLRYDTTPDQIREILDAIRALLANDDRVMKDNYRARFKEIADDALLIEIYAYLRTTNWPEFLEMAEDLNMAILDIVAASGTSLALPAQTLVVEHLANTQSG